MLRIDLQAELNRVTAELNQMKGRRDAGMAQLKQEFGLDSIEAAQEQIVLMEQENADLESEYTAQYEAFMAKYGDRVGR